MGEYADMAIDESINAWEYMERHPEEFHWTELDGGYFRNLGRLRRRKPKYKTCQFCGKSPLFFEQDEDGLWFLAEFEDDESSPNWNQYVRHACKMKVFGRSTR